MNYILNDEEQGILRQVMQVVAMMTGENWQCDQLSLLQVIGSEERNMILKCYPYFELAFLGKADILLEHFDVEIDEGVIEAARKVDIDKTRDLKRKLKKKEPDDVPRKLYISDLHFFHDGLNKQMDERGFAGYEEMNAHMIKQWNAKVKKRDEVYILGDFSISKGRSTNMILDQLAGKKYLVIGNHDERFLEDKEFDEKKFVWMKHYAEINDNGRKVILSHYPVFCYNGQYRKKEGYSFVYMLYGHVHDTYDEVLVDSFIKQTRQALRYSRYSNGLEPIPCNMINTFCMFSDYQQQTLDEWIGIDEERRSKMAAQGKDG